MEQATDYTEKQRAQHQTHTLSQRITGGGIFVTILYVTNIHCQSCVSYAKDVLFPITEIARINISITYQSIRVEHRGQVGSKIREELTGAAFEVQYFTTCDSRGFIVDEYNAPPIRRTCFGLSKEQRLHIDNCDACKANAVNNERLSASKMFRYFQGWQQGGDKVAQNKNTMSSKFRTRHDRPAIIDVDGSTKEHSRDLQSNVYQAQISIGGMTCASCVGSITKELEALNNVRSVIVNLVANNATVQFEGPADNVGVIITAIEDLGYEATLDSVTMLPPVSQSRDPVLSNVKATLSIEGMTCSVCVGTITRNLQELPFVLQVSIDLVGCSGVVEFENEDNLQQVLQKIDDLGYDATVVKVESSDASATEGDGLSERTITIAIDGMYCEYCPERIMKALVGPIRDSILIKQQPTLKDPRLSITYTPCQPELTARNFISIVESAHKAFSATIDRPPTIEERSRAIQHREQRNILLRLIFTFCVAIPTFIIGIVYMSLVPSTNNTRIWFEQPVWLGQVSRTEWALFIMTTPVMFFGADLFHTKAFKELRALWRPRSKVPILRRFYRFGSMNLLISAGTSVAYFSSVAVLILDASSSPDQKKAGQGNNTYFDSVTFLSFFILIGKFLQAYSKAKTGDAVAMLSNLRPSEAVLVESTSKESGDEVTFTRIAVDLLEVGDVVNVPHGTSPPADGTIDQPGVFLFDESSLTGESKPVRKATGDKVFAGSVNISNPVRVRITEIGGLSMLDQIVAVVREGQAKRAPIERVADLVTGYFVPVITLIAIVTFVVWLGLGEAGALPKAWLNVSQGGWAFWSLEFAISVFVVACPCGIGLAAPTALFVGGGLAAKHGILVQGGGEAFQEASKLDVIVFDKTGTLTEGKMKVTACKNLKRKENEDQQDELAIAFLLTKALEESSNHPIAKAIVEFCEKKQEELSSSQKIVEELIEEIPGKGMRGTFKLRNSANDSDSTVVYEAGIGNYELFSAAENTRKSSYFLDSTLSKFQNLGQSTAVFFLRRFPKSITSGPEPASERPRSRVRPVLVFAISDPLRSTTAHVLQTLQAQHNVSIHMCTGDNETTARAIAAQVGIPISQVRAGVLPPDKASYVHELQNINGKRRIVAFVGDGTNDAGALSAADVSIALSSGSDVAINSASFILLNSDLQTVLELVKLAKRVFWRVKANFVWAAVYNIALLPVAAGVFYPIGKHWRLGPVWSSAAMAASSVSVVTSSLALRLPEMEWSWNSLGSEWKQR